MTLDTWGRTHEGWVNLAGGSTTPVGNLVQPLSSQALHDSYWLCAQSQWTTGPYTSTDAWAQRLVELGVKQFRGVFVETNWACQQTITACRDHGLKWLMMPVPESSTAPTNQTVQQTINRVNWIADNVSDICAGLEGLNEPNQNRGTGGTTPGWEVPAFEHQQALWNTAKARTELADLPIIGASLHDHLGAQNNGLHYRVFADTGAAAYMDRLGLHRYPNAQTPEAVLDDRLNLVYDSAFGPDFPVVLTEWGYHSILGSTGHLGTSDTAQAIYGVRGLFGIAGDRGIPLMRYALIDHENHTANPTTDAEAGFGLVKVGTPVTTSSLWSAKPEFTALQTVLGQLDDPGTPYTPSPIALTVAGPSDLRHVVTRKRNGQVSVWLWREQSVWNRSTQQNIVVSTAPVVLNWGSGTANLNVGGTVVRHTFTP